MLQHSDEHGLPPARPRSASYPISRPFTPSRAPGSARVVGCWPPRSQRSGVADRALFRREQPHPGSEAADWPSARHCEAVEMRPSEAISLHQPLTYIQNMEDEPSPLCTSASPAGSSSSPASPTASAGSSRWCGGPLTSAAAGLSGVTEVGAGGAGDAAWVRSAVFGEEALGGGTTKADGWTLGAAASAAVAGVCRLSAAGGRASAGGACGSDEQPTSTRDVRVSPGSRFLIRGG